MTFLETVDTIDNWVNSCETEAQLSMCRDAIDRFITERYRNHVVPSVMANALNKLENTIHKKERYITGQAVPPLFNETLHEIFNTKS